MLSQFVFESLFSSFLALGLAILAIYGLESSFNQLVQGHIAASDIWQSKSILFLVGISIVTAVLAAAYPAFYLNSLNPGQILKGTGQKKLGGASIRNSLLAVQLVAAIVMVSGSLIISNQISFLKNKDLGFRQDNLVMIDMNNYEDKSELVKAAFSQISGVEAVSAVSNIPGGQFNQHPIYAEQDPSTRVDAAEAFMDDDAADVLGLVLLQGRLLDQTMSSDSAGTSFLINETAMHELNLKDPIDKVLFWEDNENLVKGKIVGVVKDFHYKSLHVPIRPIIMMAKQQRLNYILAQVDAQNLTSLIPQLETAYKEIHPQDSFVLRFLDQEIAKLYKEESRTLLLTSLLSGISIFLAIAGLIGIVSISIRQRVKEIGIRKILGASIQQILLLINMRYVIITSIAMIVAIPISYLSMSKWLENFTYQQSINPLIFIITAIAAVTLIFMTISILSIKTVRSNPANALRNE